MSLFFAYKKFFIYTISMGSGGFERSSPPTNGRKRRHGWRRKGLTAARREATGCCRVEGESSTPHICGTYNNVPFFFGITVKVIIIKLMQP